jgi:hypothetical protein
MLRRPVSEETRIHQVPFATPPLAKKGAQEGLRSAFIL